MVVACGLTRVQKQPKTKKQKVTAGQKRKAPSESSGGNSNETELELSNKRRVFVRPFSSGEPSIDIREVYKDKVTKEMRRGKGICLPLAQWKRLKELLPEIDEAIEKLQNN
ncbi:hypothetical protein BJV82DRAFT_601963 [Fennellomyces sp. T-0311]|nr:hypothetical protein BJV82DRAFT_601963 [Fennellomyces sp. T-0311]